MALEVSRLQQICRHLHTVSNLPEFVWTKNDKAKLQASDCHQSLMLMQATVHLQARHLFT